MPVQSLKIFLVENNEDTLTCLSLYLHDCGHVVLSARNMAAALKILSTTPVDVLICDIGLPDGDGWQLMKQLKAMNRPLPFAIAMTGYNTRTDTEKSLRAGYHHHLVKPFLPDELEIIMREAILQSTPPPVRTHGKKTRNEIALPDPA